PELAESYHQRHELGIGGIIVGAGIIAGAFVYLLESSLPDNCDVNDPNFQGCLDKHQQSAQDGAIASLFVAAVGVGVLVAGIHYTRQSHPISENDAKNMAEQYNNGIRQNLGIPVVERHWFHDVHFAPYLTHGEGGLALGARF
ncbi:MAG TPA: hypothetical protein VGO00_06585, partial [Kofleriaceae bacterium]|nr:hypothetical protein [Kofleriaceae bacterium]